MPRKKIVGCVRHFIYGAISFAVLSVSLGQISGSNNMAMAQAGYDPREGQAIINRLNQMENQMQTLSRYIYRGETPPPSAMAPTGGGASASSASVAQFDSRLSDIEFQLRSLTGQIEKQEFETRRLQQQLNEVQARLEQQAQQPQAQPQPRQDEQQPQQRPRALIDADDERDSRQAQQLTGDGATELYQEAFAALRAGDYERAEQGFENFIQRHARHELADNAHYWLAETHYVRGNFERAAVLFAEGYRNFPRGGKAADNLLKLGMSLATLDKKQDACLSFNQIGKEFPDAALAIRQRAEEQKKRLGC